MRAVDVVVAFPFIVLVIAVIAIVGPGLLGVYIGITVVGWALYARLTRAEVLVLKDQQFVLAATSLGYSHTRVMFRHILPNVIRPNLVFSTARHRAQHPRARLAVVPRPRRAAARGRVGADDRRGPDAPAHRVVDLDDAGPRRSCSPASASASSATASPTASARGRRGRAGRERGDDPRRRRGGRVTGARGRAGSGAAARGAEPPHRVRGAAGLDHGRGRRELLARRGRDEGARRRVRLGQERDAAVAARARARARPRGRRRGALGRPRPAPLLGRRAAGRSAAARSR